MSFNSFTAASLALSASVISLVAPAARADVYDSFGFYGNCDSSSLALRGPDGSLEAGGRDCRDARKWASKEASRNRRHETQSQLIGLGGNLVTGLILNSQQQKQQPAEPAGPSEAELALMKQQQELELLKLQLQLQAQQTRPVYGAPATVNYVPGYPQPPMAHPHAMHPYGAYPAAPAHTY